MGEAKRRKKLDPNFGNKRYKIEFFPKDNLSESLQKKWSEIEKIYQRLPFTCTQFTFNQEVIYGFSFVDLIEDTFALEHEWIFAPDKITKQQKIINLYVEVINKELIRKLLSQGGLNLDTESISQIFSRADESEVLEKLKKIK